MSWSATAPSNVALIKYMGKADKSKFDIHYKGLTSSSYKKDQNLVKHLSEKDKEDFYFKNLSLNPSLSYTLNHFVTKVQIEQSDIERWSPFEKDPFQDKKLYSSSQEIHFGNKLSDPDQKKFLDFFQFLKRFFLISGNYTIRSQNNFPMAAGAASSASSFAALTLAAYRLAKDKSHFKEELNNIDIRILAGLSRVGSGSSCRSFLSPWVLWTGREMTAFKSPWKLLLHQLVLVDLQTKKVSSTKAHSLVKTSPYFEKRTDRVQKRVKNLSEALKRKDWKKCFKICYKEFLDLHSLFETASPPFKYKKDSSQKVLDCVNGYWKNNNDGPLATMDAGANVHLLYRPDQRDQREEIKSLLTDYVILSSL